VGHAGRRFRVHTATVVVAVVGLAGTLAGFAVATSSVQENDRALLRQDGAQAGLYLSSLLAQTQAPFSQLASHVDPADPKAFAEAASVVSKADDGESIALLEVSGEHLEVVASVGALHRSFGGSSDASLVGMASSSAQKVQYTQVAAAGGQRWLGQLFGSGYLGIPGYAIYAELPITPVVSFKSLPGFPFSGVNGAIYLGYERPANLFFSTTSRVPLSGERAVASIDSSLSSYGSARLSAKSGSVSFPGKLILVLDATGHLSGTTSALLPWLLLSLGAAATILVDIVLAVALRRRDLALVLVDDLEVKNSELDVALKREAEAQQSLRRAQRMEAVGKLAGGIAHDFNNLLHVILSYASFISDSLGPDDPIREDVAEVQGAARRAAELTRQLLIFSRRDVVRPELVDVNEVIVGAERLIRHTLGEDIALTCLGSDEACPILVDPGELDQVLMNLAINARDAMPRGGSLAISVQRIDLSLEQASAVGLVPARHVRIDVMDTGVGMTTDVAARAFEPFFTTKETGRGTGLGLAMVYGIVERWKGHVSITSTPGEGTTVTLLFPVSTLQPEEPSEEEAEHLAPSAQGVETVLLVEDETAVRRSAARILEGAGYRVLEACDAAEAERVFERSAVDLVVTDVIMPGGMSGKELADELSSRRPEVPVVFISGYGSEAISERGVLPATTSLLEKPFTAEALLEVVHRTLVESERAPR